MVHIPYAVPVGYGLVLKILLQHSLHLSIYIHIYICTYTQRLQCSSFLVMTYFLRNFNILPEEELRSSLWVPVFISAFKGAPKGTFSLKGSPRTNFWDEPLTELTESRSSRSQIPKPPRCLLKGSFKGDVGP